MKRKTGMVKSKLLAIFLAASASAVAQNNIYVSKQQTYHSYAVGDIKSITFDADNMVVTEGDNLHVYPKSTVDSIAIVRPAMPTGLHPRGKIYASETFASDFGAFTPVTVEGKPWIIDFKTAKGTGYADGGTTRSRSFLVSPAYNLTEVRRATLSFQYVMAYTANGPGCHVYITDNYTGDPSATEWADITGTLQPAGRTSSGGIDWYTFSDYIMDIPSRYLGESHVTIALFFGCNTQSATWEVKNLNLMLDTAREGDADEVADPNNANRNSTRYAPEAWRMEFPRMATEGRNLVVSHSTESYGLTYSLEWDCDRRANRWSCYEQHDGNSTRNTSRNDSFTEDPDIPAVFQTHNADYSGTGFSRGHLCPSGDRLCSVEQNKQTFYLSNIMPQYSQHNEGLWANLESLVRNKWNQTYYRDTLYVVKAATIDNADQILTRTSTGLIVPRYFYMAVLAVKNGRYKAIGLWTENRNVADTNKDYARYAVSIRELERLTGIDFFCNLPDDIEEQAETTLTLSDWGL